MRLLAERRPATLALLLGAIMSVVFVALVGRYDYDLRKVIREKMIQRDAAVLTAVAQQEIETGAAMPADGDPARWLPALLPSARREGLLAMAVFDRDGIVLEKIPRQQVLVELSPDDFVFLQGGRPLTRYWPAYALAELVPGGPREPTPVLEIVLPLRAHRVETGGEEAGGMIGFVRYHLDARMLARELSALDAGVRRQTVVTLTSGLGALALLIGAGYALLARAQRTITERTARVQRANVELTLAAKTSALGQLTSHLVHGLQGAVAGLRAAVTADDVRTPLDRSTVAGYAEQMQLMIQEIVGLLGDRAAGYGYELTGEELADIVRRRNLPSAQAKRVRLEVAENLAAPVDGHRGGILCLIASNLVQNAIAASDAGGVVRVNFSADGAGLALLVRDAGPGIPPERRKNLFEPGQPGRVGGTGLGLAISKQLAHQIGATLELAESTPAGTVFRVSLSAAPRDHRGIGVEIDRPANFAS